MKPQPITNPPNPWASTSVEYLEEVPLAKVEVYEDHTREIVAHNDSLDLGFRFSVNPYRGTARKNEAEKGRAELLVSGESEGGAPGWWAASVAFAFASAGAEPTSPPGPCALPAARPAPGGCGGSGLGLPHRLRAST